MSKIEFYKRFYLVSSGELPEMNRCFSRISAGMLSFPHIINFVKERFLSVENTGIEPVTFPTCSRDAQPYSTSALLKNASFLWRIPESNR